LNRCLSKACRPLMRPSFKGAPALSWFFAGNLESFRTMNSPQQLSLSVGLSDYATFDNFFVSAETGNAQSLALLCQQLDGGECFIYLWGGEGAGLSHLLQAACHQALGRGLSAAYLPLTEMRDLDPRLVLA